MPKIYFLDNGVRNYFYNNYNKLNNRIDAGVLFESYYIGELIKQGEKPENIKYYRTKNKIEVDLVLDHISSVVPIELKFKNKIKTNDTLSLRKFMNTYKIETGYLVNNTQIKKSDNIKLIDCFNIPS